MKLRPLRSHLRPFYKIICGRSSTFVTWPLSFVKNCIETAPRQFESSKSILINFRSGKILVQSQQANSDSLSGLSFALCFGSGPRAAQVTSRRHSKTFLRSKLSKSAHFQRSRHSLHGGSSVDFDVDHLVTPRHFSTTRALPSTSHATGAKQTLSTSHLQARFEHERPSHHHEQQRHHESPAGRAQPGKE